MLLYIRYEIKRILISRKAKLAILLMFIMTVVMTVNNYNLSKKEDVYGKVYLEESLNSLKIYEWVLNLDKNRGNIYKDEHECHEVINQWKSIIKTGLQAEQDHDWEKYNEMNLLNAIHEYRLAQNYKPQNTYDYKYYTKYNKEVDDIIKKRNLSYINVPDLKHDTEELDVLNNPDLSVSPFMDAQYYARLFDKLLDKNLAPINHYKVDSVSIIFQTLQNLVPLYGILVICLLAFDSISYDKETGIIKNLLCIPNMRNYYIFAKTIANSIVAFLVIMLPAALLSLCFGLYDKYQMLFYPTLYFKDGLTSFHLSFNNIEVMEKMVENGTLYSSFHYNGLIRHSLYGGDRASWTAGRSPDMSLDYISLGKFLILAMIVFILFVIFINSMIMCIHTFVNSKIIGLSMSLLICILGYITTPVSNTSPVYQFHPFSYKTATEVIAGTSSYPFLTGVCLLTVLILVFQALTGLKLKKKDI